MGREGDKTTAHDDSAAALSQHPHRALTHDLIFTVGLDLLPFLPFSEPEWSCERKQGALVRLPLIFSRFFSTSQGKESVSGFAASPPGLAHLYIYKFISFYAGNGPFNLWQGKQCPGRQIRSQPSPYHYRRGGEGPCL